MTVDRRGWRVRLLTLWLPLAVAMFFALFPFYWMAITSLKTEPGALQPQGHAADRA